MNIDELSIAAIRSLCIDMINKANSGHPGMALGSAPILYALYKDHLVANPDDPKWINRDRFVLSSGHASSLLYSILHLTGYKVSMDDLKGFRQLNSITPGHPEIDLTPGVDASSGPLGQGIGQAVGLALAETSLKKIYKDGDLLIDHYTYCLCGDGCLQEGISQEAISFAGKNKLNRLILIYDANDVTLDGPLSNSFNEDVKLRFIASKWDVIEIEDGNDYKKISKAISSAKKSKEKPTLIMVHTTIGYGSKNQGLNKVHGSPLGIEDGLNAKKSYGYEYKEFEVPREVYNNFDDNFLKRGRKAYKEWNKELDLYNSRNPEEFVKLQSTMKNDISTLVFDEIPQFEPGSSDSTRNTSGKILNLVHERIFNLIGGSADVAGSVKTAIKGEADYSPDSRQGRNINFGIREFAMAAIQNGILLHGGLRTYVGSFLVFTDYFKAAIRMAALSHLPAIYLLSHDSLAVGEDGPTHQPVEQLAMLRSIPGVYVYRPCDANEVAISYQLSLRSTDHPSCIVLSRQNLPLQEGSRSLDAYRGGYIISKEKGDSPMLVLIATGSEVSLCMEAQNKLFMQGIDARVVSIPCQELFLEQDGAYIKEVLGDDYSRRLAVEMLSSFGWHRFAPHVMSVDTFGKSAPEKDVIKDYNFTVDEVVRRAREIL